MADSGIGAGGEVFFFPGTSSTPYAKCAPTMAPLSASKPRSSVPGSGKNMAGSMGRAAVHGDGIIDVSPKWLAEARERWVAEKQAELVNVIERHDDDDDLVCHLRWCRLPVLTLICRFKEHFILNSLLRWFLSTQRLVYVPFYIRRCLFIFHHQLNTFHQVERGQVCCFLEGRV